MLGLVQVLLPLRRCKNCRSIMCVWYEDKHLYSVCRGRAALYITFTGLLKMIALFFSKFKGKSMVSNPLSSTISVLCVVYTVEPTSLPLLASKFSRHSSI